MTVSRTPTLAEVLNALKVATSRGIRVALPGQVQKYDSTAQLADVLPLVADIVEDPDGNLSNTPLPVVTNVPVSWPAGGGMFLSMPLAVGDTGLLIFADRSIDAWLSQGGPQAPADLRRHHLSDAFFIPGAHDNHHALAGVDGACVTVGQSGASADFVALATAVHNQLTALKNAISSAPVAPGDGGASFKAAILAALSTWPGSVASGTVKING